MGIWSRLSQRERIAELMDELGLALLNEPASHTLTGQGACHDTSSDLSISSDVGAITCRTPLRIWGVTTESCA
ncbi:hypothetical protein MRX96_057364 [Rhipicephalus microplus]